MNEIEFSKAKSKVLERVDYRNGIGTLKEKTLHAILKNYIEPDEDYQEIPVNGFVADIYKEGAIKEIQTANFNKLRNKLESFLKDYEVTIVYPIPHIKWMSWINEETGEISDKRKSPKRGTPYECFYELYKIKQYLKDPNLKLKIILLNIEETRLLNGWSFNKKRGSSRFDRIPIEIVSEIDIEAVEDYMQLIPINVPDHFTVNDYAKAAKISKSKAGLALNVLNDLGTISRIGKKGRMYLYEVD